MFCSYKKSPHICIIKRGQQVLRDTNGVLAQLVQSTCLTSRGSLVRIQYAPQRTTQKVVLFLCLYFSEYPYPILTVII